MNRRHDFIERPTAEQFERELKRRTQERELHMALWSSARTLIVFAAVAVLISTLLIPVFQVQNTSMTPTLQNNDLVIFVTIGKIKTGDIIAFHYNNKVLIKRVIATSGELLNIDEDGMVYINEAPLKEPYITRFSLGECDLTLPVKIPERHYFVMGDNRQKSIDSRTREIGTIHSDYIVGKAIFRIWPLTKMKIF